MRRRPSPRRATSVLVLLAALLAPGASPAQAPAGSPARPLAVRLVLPNGVVALVAERPALPIVTVRVAVGGGAALDPPDKAGLANLTALTLTRGTRTRSGPEIDRAIEFVGGSLEAEGGRDWSELSLSVLRRDLGLGLDLLADVLLHPTFPPEEFDRKLEEVRGSLRRADEDPDTVAARLVRRLIFPGHPYANPVPGTETSVARIARSDAPAFHAATCRPETTVIAVVGDVTVDEVRDGLAARFGRWTVGRAEAVTPAMAPQGRPPGTELVQRDLTQASVYVGEATVTRGHPDYYPLLVAGHVLGGGASSRLYGRVREERGLAYSIFAQLAPARYGGLFVVGFQSENARVREVLALVREELVRLRRERITDAEVASAKAYLIGSFVLRMDTNAELASLLVLVEEYGLGLDYPARYRQAVEEVTADHVRRAVQAHWDPDAMSLAVVANLREAGLAP